MPATKKPTALAVHPKKTGTVIDAAGCEVAWIAGGVDGSPADLARLFAAAPDLLAALKRLIEERCPFTASADDCECGENGDGIGEDGKPCEHRQAYAAIDKATKGS